MEYYYILSALLFSIGLMVCITKKNAIVVLMGIELMLNAANINFVAMSMTDTKVAGQFFALFVIVVAAAEAAVALAIVIKLYNHFKTVDLDRINQLKG
ncbi:NADH-quinone oxidoreductase subunit NuoK [Fulvivirga sp. RKSG066]|uniref:NADH-quinone oxidoreductase subunit NuoK n=1 Tax=Fulvivirga aurantia TaxID=2529383 RepID=UPI0016274EF2|nr:NADH-quinone oxidoreductase subunit NuoK [Fulvivirga aurantia]